MFDFVLENNFLSAILAFGIVLIPAILVHELGHFIAGKSVGITILEFGIGFPPRIVRLFTWRETEFTLNMIPLGGFVRPLGEDLVGPSRDEETIERDRELARERTTNASADVAYEGSPFEADLEELRSRGITEVTGVNDVAPLPRIWFLAAGAIANFIFAYLVFVLIGLTGVPEEIGIRIGLVSVDANSSLIDMGLQRDDYIERINGEYFNSTEEFLSLMGAAQGEVTLQIRRLGAEDDEPDEVFNITVPPFDMPPLPEGIGNGYVYVTTVDADSPAAEAGFLEGDMIATVNGERLSEDVDPVVRLQELVADNAGSEVTLSFLRDGELMELSLVPRLNPPDGQGRIGIHIGPYGVFNTQNSGLIITEVPQFVPVSLPVSEAVNYGFTEISSLFRTIAEFPVRLMSGSTEPEERRIVSVVGISQYGGRILQDSVEEEQATPLLTYIALISIALGFTNLLPIPALDGGRILFVIIEMVRGKPISPEREGIVHLVGLIFLLSIGVFFIINDLVNPLTDLVP